MDRISLEKRLLFYIKNIRKQLFVFRFDIAEMEKRETKRQSTVGTPPLLGSPWLLAAATFAAQKELQ